MFAKVIGALTSANITLFWAAPTIGYFYKPYGSLKVFLLISIAAYLGTFIGEVAQHLLIQLLQYRYLQQSIVRDTITDGIIGMFAIPLAVGLYSIGKKLSKQPPPLNNYFLQHIAILIYDTSKSIKTDNPISYLTFLIVGLASGTTIGVLKTFFRWTIDSF